MSDVIPARSRAEVLRAVLGFEKRCNGVVYRYETAEDRGTHLAAERRVLKGTHDSNR